MRIEFSKLHLTPQPNLSQIKKQDAPKNLTGSNAYNPTYYQDYNINFNARLFRTPANFFEQDFNRNGMPETMKNYLFADYEDRQNMPPNQMLKLVFNDISETKSLEQVKRIYPEETLFDNLRETPNRKVRTGVIAEIDLMKDEGVPLFKDKDVTLGMYILKKIYLEGKTLKEINKDFQNDITEDFKGLSPVDYSTLAAYGIKYPKMSFWKSFIATREDFPYEYKPRKAVESRIQKEEPKEMTLSDIKKAYPKLEQKKKFDGVKDWEIDRLTDIVINGNGNADETRKYMKKRNIKPNENSSFAFKYSSPIMSVALEKIHASDEMKEFYENYDSSTKSQREIMDAYWKNNPQANALRSMAMKDTIKLFMDAYGIDGNNEEFQDLLLYADNIKPLRKEKEKAHDRIQAEYDEMFANLLVEKEENVYKPDSEPVEKPKISTEEMEALLEEEALKNGAKIFKFTSPDGTNVRFVVNINEEFDNTLRQEIQLLPGRFAGRYLSFIKKSELATDDYKESIVLLPRIPDFARDQFMPPEIFRTISAEINREFQKKYPQILLANDQALAERIIGRLSDKFARALEFDTQTLMQFANDNLKIENWTPQERAQMESDYEKYLKPVDNKADINKINQELISYIATLNPDDDLDLRSSLPEELVKLLAANIKAYPQMKSMMSKVIRQTKFVESYGGSSKILLNPDTSTSVKKVKCKLMFEDIVNRNIKELIPLLAADTDNVKKYITDSVLATLLMQSHLRLSRNDS